MADSKADRASFQRCCRYALNPSAKVAMTSCRLGNSLSLKASRTSKMVTGMSLPLTRNLSTSRRVNGCVMSFAVCSLIRMRVW